MQGWIVLLEKEYRDGIDLDEVSHAVHLHIYPESHRSGMAKTTNHLCCYAQQSKG
jgi:hypothetical protein